MFGLRNHEGTNLPARESNLGTCGYALLTWSAVMTKLVDELRQLLQEGRTLSACRPNSERQLVRALTMLINDGNEVVRQRACWELGEIISRTAPSNVENFIRRLMWRLNPESGDNPRGVPEAIGEIGNRAPEHAESFVPALMQYLEDENLRPGLLQAAGRIGQSSPGVLSPYIDEIASYLCSEDIAIVGNAALALVRIGGGRASETLRAIESDTREVPLFCYDDFITVKLCEFGKQICLSIEKLCVITAQETSKG